ncbi:MAG: DUF5752 family protein [Candidatus Omnitrophota bacterium]
MAELRKADKPFSFHTRLHLSELTGLRASTLDQLLDLIKRAPDSAIYYHTHAFLQHHHYVIPEPPNDFAYWVNEVLQERPLGEELLNIDTVQYSSIAGLRRKIIEVISAYLRKNPLAWMKFVKNGEAFYFIKAISFIVPTPYRAYDLSEFAEVLRKVTVDSIYFHIFESRLRLGRKTNDFSAWIEGSLGDPELAGEISRLNPYMYTLEELRSEIIKLIEKRIWPA